MYSYVMCGVLTWNRSFYEYSTNQYTYQVPINRVDPDSLSQRNTNSVVTDCGETEKTERKNRK